MAYINGNTKVNLAAGVAMLQRLTGTTDGTVYFNSGRELDVAGLFAGGNPAPQLPGGSFDSNGSGQSAIAGLKAGHDQVVVPKSGIEYQTKDDVLKQVTYHLYNGDVVTLQAPYVDWIW